MLQRILSKKSYKCIVSKLRSFHNYKISEAKYDLNYLTNPSNYQEISENIKKRKGVGDIRLVQELYNKLKDENLDSSSKESINKRLKAELAKIPNKTHPAVSEYGETPKIVSFFNKKPELKHDPYEFSELCKKLNIIRTDYLGNFTGHKSYFLMNDLAELEQALIRYTLDKIMQSGFQLMTVPDILPAKIIQSCGMQTDGERNQVYKLMPKNNCLSGTSEMSLAGYFAGRNIESKKLPVKCTAVSRCFRAETSGLLEEKGIYRVHQFTKVEMFSICSSNQSETILEEFREIEIDLFKSLGIHFKLLDMPPFELGSPAYRKYDIEAWMPGRGIWGEISSCSNCTDYQARKLNIFEVSDNKSKFAHTVNGTACAIPRMLIALIETFQTEDGSVMIPDKLKKYTKLDKIYRRKVLPELKLVKNVVRN